MSCGRRTSTRSSSRKWNWPKDRGIQDAGDIPANARPGDRRWNVLNCATARMYVSWVLGDKLRIVMSSIMRWRRGEIGLVIGGLLSVGLHERAILADRTPPTMLQLRLGRPTDQKESTDEGL